MANIRSIRVEAIMLDPEIQPRVRMNQSTIDDYSESVKSGIKLPPIVVYRDESGAIMVADGFNRVMAHKAAKLPTIEAEVRKGSKRDAILFAVGANSEHGQRRTNDDKRNAAMKLLNDPEWSSWSDTRIAEQCAVSHQYINKLRSESCNNGKIEHVRLSKTGTLINTSNIGKSQVNGQAAPDPPDVAKARASGKIPAAAIAEVCEPVEPTSLEDVAEAIEETASQTDDQLSDGDWVASLPLASQLTRTQLKIFTADALVYRRLEKPRGTFRHHASRAVKSNDKGEYAYRVSRFLRVDHPRHWIKCPTTENGGCGGIGVVKPLGECPKCRGRGYWIK